MPSHSLKILFPYFFKEKIRLSLALLTGFFLSLTGIFLPLCLGKFYQLGLQTNSVRGQMLDRFSFIGNTKEAFITFFLCVICVRLILAFLFSRQSHRLSHGISNRIIKDFYRAQINSDWNRFSAKDYGKYLNRYSGNLDSVNRLISEGCIRFVSDIVFLICCLALFFMLDTSMAWIVVFAIVVFAVPVIIIQKKQSFYTQKIKDKKSGTLAFVQFSFNNFFTDWIFNKNKLKSKRFDDHQDKLEMLSIKKNNLQSVVDALARVFPWVILCSLMTFVLIIRADKSSNGTSELLVFFMLIVNISSVLRRTLKIKSIWDSGISSLSKMLNWLKETKKDSPIQLPGKKAQKLEIMGVQINQKSVSFKLEVGENLDLFFENKADINAFIIKLSSIQLENKETIILDGNALMHENGYEFRRSITFIGRQFEPSGKTMYNALAYSLKEENDQAINDFYTKLNLKTPPLKQVPEFEKWTSEEYFVFQCCRAWLTQKPFIFIDQDFEKTIAGFSEALHERILAQFFGKSIIRLHTIQHS
jgi:ABC-type multidrug transport system fused ATPase/permease subunit